MFQDLDVGFDNAFRRAAPEDGSVALVFRGDSVLAGAEDGGLRLPTFGALPREARGLKFRYAFELGGTSYILADWGQQDTGDGSLCASERSEYSGQVQSHREPSPVSPSPLSWVPSREYRGMGPKEAVFAAAVGESLHRWYCGTRFCGACGAALEDSGTERARVCPACGGTVYPKIAPAVIAAVTDGDRLLLTRYRGRAFKRWALVAGFAEIGEPIEDTVRREVLEETGLRVRNLRYYKSQPWVFTDSLLFGFWCELEGSDAVTLQLEELSQAVWFRREEIPEDFNPVSLTGEMITRFREGAL